MKISKPKILSVSSDMIRTCALKNNCLEKPVLHLNKKTLKSITLAVQKLSKRFLSEIIKYP